MLLDEVKATLAMENLSLNEEQEKLLKSYADGKITLKEYQELLLKAKVGSIEENINNNNVETIYSFQNFVIVLNTGFDLELEVQDNEFEEIMNVITNYYMMKGI